MPEAETATAFRRAFARHGPWFREVLFSMNHGPLFQTRRAFTFSVYTKREKRVFFFPRGHAIPGYFTNRQFKSVCPNRIGIGISCILFANSFGPETRELSRLYRSGGPRLSTFFARKGVPAIEREKSAARAKKQRNWITSRTRWVALELCTLGHPGNIAISKRRAEEGRRSLRRNGT